MFHFNVLVVSWKGKTVTRKALHPLNDCRHWVDRGGPYSTASRYRCKYGNHSKTRRCLWWNGLWLRSVVSQQKAVLTFSTRQNAQCILSGPWQGRSGTPGCPSGGKCGKCHDLDSERSGEHLRYMTQPVFQDDLGVVRPEFQANRVDGKGLQVSYSLVLLQLLRPF